MDQSPEPRRRNLGRRIAAGVVIGLAGVAISYIIAPKPPVLLAGLAGSWDAKNAELVRRVATGFPAGSSAGAMRQALLDQGFTVSSDKARWEGTDYPCRTYAAIEWQAREGKIVSTGASMFEVCPKN